jgi:DNA-binding response OmpR family regulator
MSSALQRPHILVVTDHPDLSDFLGEGLVYAGLWTSVIASAVQTLEVLRLRSFDALLLDTALGGMGAIELARRLRGRSDRSPGLERTDIPILLIVDVPGGLDAAHLDEIGIDRVIYPPIELDELANEITSVVTAWRALHPGRKWADEAAMGRA